MSHILGHVAYKGALWSVDNLPACLQGEEASPKSIIIEHNRVCGELLAGLEKDMGLAAQLQDLLERDLIAAREGKAKAEARVKCMSDTVRRLGERVKELEARELYITGGIAV